MQTWLDPLDKLAVIKAVQTKQATVVLRPRPSQLSQLYELRYESTRLKIQRIPTNYMHYEPASPLPLAYIEITTILDPNGRWFEHD